MGGKAAHLPPTIGGVKLQSQNQYARNLLLECDCGSHAIELTKFHDEDEIYLGFWFRGLQVMTFWERLRAIWSIFIRGRSYHFEEIILTKQDAKELRDFLDDILSTMV